MHNLWTGVSVSKRLMVWGMTMGDGGLMLLKLQARLRAMPVFLEKV